MNSSSPVPFSARPRRFVGLGLILGLLVAGSAFAQSKPSTETKPAPETTPPAEKTVPVENAPPAEEKKAEDVIELSPFVVNTSQDVGYQATSTLAGTRLNTNVKDVGAAVSIYTKEFLDDINVTKVQDILSYTASTEGAGPNGNYAGVTGESSAEVRDDPSSVNRVRALAQATRTRDFFATDIPGDTYNFDTFTVNRGPNAILAGVGNAGGIMDAALRKPTFKDNYRVVTRFSSYESHREELHFNKVLIPKRLAVRFDLLNDEKKFRQEPAYETDQRLYAALLYRVIQPKRGSFLGLGTFRANFERGHIEGVPPDPLTPTFTVANWFNPINPKWRWNGALQQLQNSAGAPLTGPSATTGVIQGFPLFTQMALIFANPSSGTAGVGFTDATLAGVQGFQGGVPATLAGSPGGSVRSSGDANRLRPGFVRTHLSDPQIFNYYDRLMTGAFDFRDQRFNASDFRYEQLLLGGKAGFEAAYNYQEFTRRRDFPIPTGGNDEGIMVDVNSVLSVRSAAFPNGIPNPNFGRPFISTTDVFRDQTNRTTRESLQFSAFYRHDFTQGDSKWAKLLGRHTVSALLFNTEIERFNRTYSSTWDPNGQINPQSSLNGAAPGTFGTQANGWFYIGPSLLSVNSLQDVRLDAVGGTRPQIGQTYTLQVYDPVSRRFVTGTSTPLRILSRLVDQREELNSTAFALQSHWLKDHIITVFGWREDNDEAFSSVTPARLANGSLDDSNVAFQPAVAQGKRSWTKSVVGRLPYKLPFDSELRAHWNESGNFNPVGQRRNVWNEELGSPTAETGERGVSLSTFGGKFELRVNRYKTEIQDDSIANVGNPYTYTSTMIGRMLAARDAGLLPANFNYNFPGWTSFSNVALALYETIPARLKANIGADKNFNPRFTGSGSTLQWTAESIINLSSISDTESTGTEFEAIINPAKGWRVSVSVAKNEAVKSSVAVEELAYAAEWKNNLDTMFNGALLPGARNPIGNELGRFYDQYVAEQLPSIRTASALSGATSPEIRKWRANLVSRYEFQRGLLRGLSVGGAVRWQDRIGIGYPFVTVNGVSVADVTRPYYGPKDTQFDLNAGYKRRFKLRGHTINWNIGVNVINLNAKDEVIPIAANADGTYGTFRIPPEKTWSITNAFSF